MYIYLALFFSFLFTQYYELGITQTGQSHLIVIQESVNLSSGVEIGVFDHQAIINDESCETEYGELLVANGVWDGIQLNLVAIGAIDFCDIGGEQRSGYIENNEIKIRIYNPIDFTEYTTSFDGLESNFVSGYVTAITEISVDDIYSYNFIDKQDIPNNISINKIYPNPANPLINIDYELFYKESLIISIYSISGEPLQIIRNPITNVGLNTIKLNLSDYSSGIYLFKMKSKNNSIMKKFIILK